MMLKNKPKVYVAWADRCYIESLSPANTDLLKETVARAIPHAEGDKLSHLQEMWLVLDVASELHRQDAMRRNEEAALAAARELMLEKMCDAKQSLLITNPRTTYKGIPARDEVSEKVWVLLDGDRVIYSFLVNDIHKVHRVLEGDSAYPTTILEMRR